MVEKSKTATSDYASAGVEALILRLRDEGVGEGKAQADKILLEANQKAAAIKEQAKREADELVATARKEVAALKAAGKDALQLAARDAHLKLKEIVMERFSGEVRRLVGTVMEPEPFLEKLILEVAGRARKEAGMAEQKNMVIKLPEQVIGIDDLRKKPEELKEGTLAHFVLSLMGSLLREGISYQPAGDVTGGLKVYLQDGDVEVDLTDETIAAVLLEHLQPRFRALVEGIVK